MRYFSRVTHRGKSVEKGYVTVGSRKEEIEEGDRKVSGGKGALVLHCPSGSTCRHMTVDSTRS